MGLMGMVSDSIPTSICRICPAPLPIPLQHPLPPHVSLVKQMTSLGRYFGPGFSQVKMGAGEDQRDLLGRKRSQGKEGEAQEKLERYLSFSPLCIAPTAAEQEEGTPAWNANFP